MLGQKLEVLRPTTLPAAFVIVMVQKRGRPVTPGAVVSTGSVPGTVRVSTTGVR